MSNDRFVIRRPSPDEARAASNVMRAALLFAPTSDDDWERWGAGWTEGYVPISAWEGTRCVGNAGAFLFDTVVPGGAWLPTAGVTRVGVLPSHSRQGLLTRMMHQLLSEQRAEGKVLASLRASEAPIYGRFGFGLAGEATEVLVDPARIRPMSGVAAGSCRLLLQDEILGTVPPVYERINHRAGAISRDSWMWKRVLNEAIEAKKANYVVVHTSPDGVDDGYAIYSVEWIEGDFVDIGGKCTLAELFGTSPAVELALWNYLTGLGLVRSIVCGDRPIDDPLRTVAHDYRAYDVKRRWDEQWLRLLDVEAALRARTYAERDPVTIAVTDPMFPENECTFRVGPAGAERTSDTAELVAPIASVSAAYMGSVAWRDLLAVGKVEGTLEAARRADDLFRHWPTTWSGTFF